MFRPTRPLVTGFTLCVGSLLALSACQDEEQSERFGFTCLDLAQDENEPLDPFAGTAEIKLTLKYESCLIDYYMKNHVEQRLDGAVGPDTFEAWRERLCTEDIHDPLVGCEIPDLDAFQQTLWEKGSTSVYQMTITYKITDTSKIHNRTLLWGPGPFGPYAECQRGERPSVKFTESSDVIGLDKNGAILWSAQTWSNPRGVIQPSSGTCMRASIRRGG